MPYVLRAEEDTDNPLAVRAYGRQITQGRLIYYKPNAQGSRTAFMALLCEGARDLGDDGIDRIVKAYYSGFELPEFDATGGRNWRLHPGTLTVPPVLKPYTIALVTGLVTSNGHGYANDFPIRLATSKKGPTGFSMDFTVYFVRDVTANTFKIAATVGGAAIIPTDIGSGNQWAYGSLQGVGDPVQGGWSFFPTLKWSGSGLAIVEVLLPAELSTGGDEPSKAKFVLSCKLVKTYPSIDGAGLLVEGPSTPEPNNALVLLDMARFDAKMPLRRFHGQDWLDFIARCAEGIPWAGGAGDGLTADYYSDETLTTLVFSQIEEGINRLFTGTIAGPGVPTTNFSARWHGFIKVAKAGNYTFSASYDDGVRLWVNGVQLINDWASGALRETSGSIALEAQTDYAIVLEYFQVTGPASVSLSYESTDAEVPKQFVPAAVLYSIVGAVRTIARFDAHVFFKDTTAFPTAWEAVFFRAPGCDWQDTSGKIRIYSTPDRPVVHVFGPTNIVDDDSFKVYRRSPEDKFNFFRMRFRNLDSSVLLRGFAETDRPLLRELIGGRLNDTGLIDGGVMRQSLADRILESMARFTSDLDVVWELVAFHESYHVSKGDFCHVAEEIAGTSEASPALGIVLSEKFLFDSMGKKQFVIQAVNPAYYSDSDHGVIAQLVPSGASNQLRPPPALASLGLAVVQRALSGGALTFSIEGIAVFQNHAQQRGRVYWHRPSDAPGIFQATGISIIPDSSTLSASFYLDNAQPGMHEVRVVTETLLGVVSTEAPLEEPIEVIVPTPIDVVAIRIANDVAATWEPGLGGDSILPETYIVRVRQVGTGTLKRTHTVRLAESVPCQWTYHSGAGDQGKISLDPDGTIEAATPTVDSLNYHSQIFVGDAKINFEVDDRVFFAFYILDAVSGSVRAEITNAVTFGGGPIEKYDPEISILFRRRLLPGQMVGIDIRNAKTEYQIDDQFWMRGFINPTPQTFRVRASFISAVGDPLNHPQAFLRTRVRPYKPRQFVYTEDMQKEDFGAGSVPATVQLDIVQVTADGAESAPATVVV